jgi:hypothetical protein
MSDASNGDSNVLQKLQSYKETKESMKKLRDNVQKHLSQRVWSAFDIYWKLVLLAGISNKSYFIDL